MTSQSGKHELNCFFSHQVCMNWIGGGSVGSDEERFAKHNITDVAMSSAIDGERVSVSSRLARPPGAWGCCKVIWPIIPVAREARWPILIFEDDVVATRNSAGNSRVHCSLPPDWDMVFLGCMHRSERFE